jgi:hypothetical protein
MPRKIPTTLLVALLAIGLVALIMVLVNTKGTLNLAGSALQDAPSPANITVSSACSGRLKERKITYTLTNTGGDMAAPGALAITRSGPKPDAATRQFTLTAGQQTTLDFVGSGLFTATITDVPNAPVTDSRMC